jgi:hypothetical protein
MEVVQTAWPLKANAESATADAFLASLGVAPKTQFTLRYEPDEIDEPKEGGYNGDKSGEIDEGMWVLPRHKMPQ